MSPGPPPRWPATSAGAGDLHQSRGVVEQPERHRDEWLRAPCADDLDGVPAAGRASSAVTGTTSALRTLAVVITDLDRRLIPRARRRPGARGATSTVTVGAGAPEPPRVRRPGAAVPELDPA